MKRFVPGETAEDALAEAARLELNGFTTLLTYLGENVSNEVEASSVTRRYLDLLDMIEREGLDSHISIKLTQIGLEFDRTLCLENLHRLASRADETGSTVWIDMESSTFTDITLDLFQEILNTNVHVGICLQSYLKRTADDLDALLPLSPLIRLVKGAYQEPSAIAFVSKNDVDDNFENLALRFISSGTGKTQLALGTHDEELIDMIIGKASEIEDDALMLEIQMLYGIGVQTQQRLLSEGQRVRVLLNFGEAWYSWYLRRLAERPANIWFVLRNIFIR
ncbi:proline dehydrogenase family protein [Gemmatimonadota bacterium]